jgi:dephospho-CoA kinase
MAIYIGLVGEIGSGKEDVSKFIAQEFDGRMKGVAIVKFSALVSETLALWGLPPTRNNLQRMVRVMEENFGEGTLAGAVKQRLINEPAEVIIIDGVRWWADFELIRWLPRSVLVYVTAPADLRYSRVSRRTEKPDEINMTREKFDEDEKALNEVNIPLIGARADYRIDNTVSYGELHSLAEDVARDVLRKFQ